MNDTSIIDEKSKLLSGVKTPTTKVKTPTTKVKTPTSKVKTPTYTSKVMGFVFSVIITFIIILVYFSSSGLILFVCKLAQSNILPTSPACAPYTNTPPNITPTPMKTNIFTTIFTDPEMSMKLEIPYDAYNSKNTLIDMFREYKERSSSNFLANYFISITENLMQFDYSLISIIMNLFNNLPEILVVGLGPIAVSFLIGFGLLLNGLYFMYLWFFNMYWFFKTNNNNSDVGEPEWENVTLLSPVKWCIGFWFVIIFIYIFFFGLPFISFIPFATIHLCILSCLFYKGIFNGKSVTSFSMIKEILKHYKLTLVSLISIFIILFSFLNLGTNPGIFSIVTVILIYAGAIGINEFYPIKETILTPSVSYDQAIKKCYTVSKNSGKHGFLYNLLFGQKGGNITKQLKQIRQKL